MISTTAACGYLPSAAYIGGPLDGRRAAPLRRKSETVHPQQRTIEGRTARYTDAPTGPHYTHVNDGTWAGYYAYITQAEPLAADGGTSAPSCSVCSWSYPPGRWTGHGTPPRPGSADYIDVAGPHIWRHIEGTGHPVRVVLTTWWPMEQSSTLFGPRSNDQGETTA